MCVPVFGVSGVPLVFGKGGGPFFLENKKKVLFNLFKRHCFEHWSQAL